MTDTLLQPPPTVPALHASPLQRAEDGRRRAVVDAVLPAVDGGRFAVKRVAGERLEIEAHCFADGHDVLRVLLLWRNEADAAWQHVAMTAHPNDVWRAAFTPPAPGRYR